jgi:hypothetical protein
VRNVHYYSRIGIYTRFSINTNGNKTVHNCFYDVYGINNPHLVFSVSLIDAERRRIKSQLLLDMIKIVVETAH